MEKRDTSRGKKTRKAWYWGPSFTCGTRLTASNCQWADSEVISRFPPGSALPLAVQRHKRFSGAHSQGVTTPRGRKQRRHMLLVAPTRVSVRCFLYIIIHVQAQSRLLWISSFSIPCEFGCNFLIAHIERTHKTVSVKCNFFPKI